MNIRQAFRGGMRHRMLGGLLLAGLTGAFALGGAAAVAEAAPGAATVASAAVAHAASASAAEAQAAPAKEAPATSTPLGGVRAADDDNLDDFTFNSFNGDYTIDRDADGHSTLTTVETFDAQFPDFDRNRGFIRAIPEKYHGHPTDLTLVSVTDGSGQTRPYSTDSDDGLLLVTLAGDDYVRGQQTYVLTFTQQYVTDYFADTNDDEFYWDTIGTQTKQPTTAATASVHVAADLAASLNGSTACYIGAEGSTNTCDLRASTGADGSTTFETGPHRLAALDNVSVVVGFAPGTFTPRNDSFWASPAAIASLVLTVIAVLLAVLAIVNRLTRLRDAPGRPTIIAEYTPPRGVNLLLASVITRHPQRGPAAAFVDLAVRRNIQIVEQPAEGRGSPSYWLRFVTAAGLDETELALAKQLFGEPLVSGAWKQLEKRDTTLATGISGLMTSARKATATEGYVRSGATAVSWLCVVLVILAAVAAFITGGAAVGGAYGGGWPYLLFGLSALSVVVTFFAGFRNPLTAKGAELRDYIEGLKLYIRLAEKDRFEMLQSPEGAQKTQVSAPDRGQVVRIYEKLLPYAVLLDLEKEWSEVLGTYYENLGTQPDWYGGNVGAFNAAYFASSIGSLSSSVGSSLASSTSSSSSGGSGGGGFSGGGGGGGGTSGV
ncbi:DUF2207 domain-containing protein [Subtercola sp. Z020]|uniref:DUF2207 domain-containing protein n=1 Tax=Subtercola sp. Z020 TaxID=2080582 RepID=UPI00130E2E90|nr:DUF2207 domain-containing protein [Subtercola sp. Z020]